MLAHGKKCFRRFEHIALARSAQEMSKLRHFLKGVGKISKVARVPTWRKHIPIRRIGETLFFKCPCDLDFAGVPDQVPAFVGVAWEDKLVKILQGPYLTSVVAALDVGSCADRSSFEDCTSMNNNGVREYRPVESTEVRIGLVSPRFLARPVLQEVGKVASDRNLVSADDIAEAYNRASIAGKLVWYVTQNLVPEPGKTLFKELPNAISALGAEDAKELVSAPELEDNFGSELLAFCLCEGELRGFVHSYNLARLYSAVPCPASTHDNAKESLEMILAKGEKIVSKDEQERVTRNYLLAAVASQKELKAAYEKTNQPLRVPSEYDFESSQWVPREHWAAKLPLWTLLTDAEKQAAHECDFTVNEVPSDAAEVYWASQSKGAMFNPDSGEVGLETVESLKSAPLMWGMTGKQIRHNETSKRFAKLVSRKKTESGKWNKKKTRHFWVASFPAKCCLRTYNNNARTVVCLLPHFAPGASGKQRLQSKKAVCSWLCDGS